MYQQYFRLVDIFELFPFFNIKKYFKSEIIEQQFETVISSFNLMFKGVLHP